ncbi:Uncharacterized protein HZ326_5063 [Fusarium oxysporum f. sp. albedinis]|nr:Uncharacterized protein HZ326_5063 [Fusarium oxysporum f. sp. albedinis]
MQVPPYLHRLTHSQYACLLTCLTPSLRHLDTKIQVHGFKNSHPLYYLCVNSHYVSTAAFTTWRLEIFLRTLGDQINNAVHVHWLYDMVDYNSIEEFSVSGNTIKLR